MPVDFPIPLLKRVRKQIAIYIYPTLAFLYIWGDWRGTRQLKQGERKSLYNVVLNWGEKEEKQEEALLDSKAMGTFTWSYFFKSWTKKHQNRIFISPFLIYLGYYYYNSCIYKRSMMKGKSHLHAGRRAEIEAWAKKTRQEIDIWKY